MLRTAIWPWIQRIRSDRFAEGPKVAAGQAADQVV